MSFAGFSAGISCSLPEEVLLSDDEIPLPPLNNYSYIFSVSIL